MLLVVIVWAMARIFTDFGGTVYQRSIVVISAHMSPPEFSHTSGFYSHEFYLTLSSVGANETIRFTLDGSEPTIYSQIYTSPIRIYSPLAIFPNSPMTMGSRPMPLPRPYYNGMVVRARVFNDRGAGSAVVTRSFFVERQVGGTTRGSFNMRVVSISIEPEYFVAETGMYQNYNMDIRRMSYVEVFYPDGTPMFSQNAQLRVSGNWSRRERKKSLRLNFNAGDGIVDSLDLVPDTRQSFYAPLEPVSLFRHITLRTADLHQTTIREALATRVGEPLRPDVHNATPAAVFVNGEFWGIYCLRGHRGRTFIAAHHPGISEDSVVQLDFAWNERNSGDHSNCTSRECLAFQVSPGQLYPLNPCFAGVHEVDGPFGPWLDENNRLPRQHPLFRVDFEEGRDEGAAYRSWMRMYNAITGGRVYCDDCMKARVIPQNCDECRFGFEMSNHHDFWAAMEFVCLDNLIDIFIAYYHFDNWDWPGNNLIMWKSDTIYLDVPAGDGKWRFIIHDFDNAFWNPRRNSMNLFTTPGTGHGAGTGGAPHSRLPYYHDNQPMWAVEIWRNLLESEIFRSTLAARYSTYTGTVFSPARMNHIIDELVAEREADIGSNFYRWNRHGGDLHGSVEGWLNSVEHLRYFAGVRGEFGLRHIREYFNRTDRPHLGLRLPSNTLNISWRTDTRMGFFDIAGAQIRPDLFEKDGPATFDINDFSATYIWGLPIEVAAVPFDGYRFSHFEIVGMIGEVMVIENPMIIDLSDIAPPPGVSSFSVTAVFEGR